MAPSALNVSRVFDPFTGYQRTAALRAAIDIGLFTAVGGGANTLAAIAERCGAAERGVRALANRLGVGGFLPKDGQRSGLPPKAAVFLGGSSPAYIGTMMRFLTAPMITAAFDSLTEAVRRGGTPVGPARHTPPGTPVSLD